METSRANQIIVEVLQECLKGQLDPSSNFNPQNVAAAISTKVEFEKTYSNTKGDAVAGTLIDKITSYISTMESELTLINPEELIFANFIRGKITAYNEVLDLIKTL